MDIYLISFLLFQTFMIPVMFFSIVFYLVTIGSIFTRPKKFKFDLKTINWPFVTIQIPVYNDPIAIRCIESSLRLDYPKDRYEIVVADDSTDEKTRRLLDRYANNPLVKIVRRDNRKGFKAGALNNALKYSRGEIIVIFDSDNVPPRNFLKEIVRPFMIDDKIAIVQARARFLNFTQNIITRFAATLLTAYHHIWLPVADRFNALFFCGSFGAIRRSVLEEIGGWNETNITEDADLSVRIIDRGYKTLYIPELRVFGEVPFSISGFIKQQMRWVYGETRTFFDHWRRILFSKNLRIMQKIFITFTTLGGVVSPFVIGMTLFGQIALFTAPLRPVNLFSVLLFARNFILTAGFLFMVALALFVAKRGFTIPRNAKLIRLVILSLPLGLYLSIYNTIAFFKGVLNVPMTWHITPKWGTKHILEKSRV